MQLPGDVSLAAAADAVHLTHSIREARTLLSHNYRDFEDLHDLVMQAQGHHPGVLVVRRDNDPKRDLSARGIVRAIGNLQAAGVPLVDSYHVLNHWR